MPKIVTTSPETRAAVIEWYKQKQALGTYQSQARKMGMSLYALESIISRYRNPQP